MKVKSLVVCMMPLLLYSSFSWSLSWEGVCGINSMMTQYQLQEGEVCEGQRSLSINGEVEDLKAWEFAASHSETIPLSPGDLIKMKVSIRCTQADMIQSGMNIVFPYEFAFVCLNQRGDMSTGGGGGIGMPVEPAPIPLPPAPDIEPPGVFPEPEPLPFPLPEEIPDPIPLPEPELFPISQPAPPMPVPEEFDSGITQDSQSEDGSDQDEERDEGSADDGDSVQTDDRALRRLEKIMDQFLMQMERAVSAVMVRADILQDKPDLLEKVLQQTERKAMRFAARVERRFSTRIESRDLNILMGNFRKRLLVVLQPLLDLTNPPPEPPGPVPLPLPDPVPNPNPEPPPPDGGGDGGVRELLEGRWELVGFADSGNPAEPVPPGTFLSFQQGQVAFADCPTDGGFRFKLSPDGMSLSVEVAPGSIVTWTLLTLNMKQLVFEEGTDVWYLSRSGSCQ